MSRIKLSIQKCLFLDNLSAKRDSRHARDYVVMQWRMLQHAEPNDFVFATSKQHSVREFCYIAGVELGIEITCKTKALMKLG